MTEVEHNDINKGVFHFETRIFGIKGFFFKFISSLENLPDKSCQRVFLLPSKHKLLKMSRRSYQSYRLWSSSAGKMSFKDSEVSNGHLDHSDMIYMLFTLYVYVCWYLPQTCLPSCCCCLVILGRLLYRPEV